MKIYQKLDDWISVSSKAENDAIDEVCDVVKDAIEDQGKIQDELRIKFMDFFVDKGILNFIEPPPEKLAAMEEAQDGKFNIPQLRALIEELKLLADSDDQILNRKAVELLLRKAQNSRSLGDMGGLPKEWSSFTHNDFEKLVRNLDIYNTGSIDYKVLATCCVLLKSPLPKDDQIEAVKKSLQQGDCGRANFKEVPFWFEATEASKDREYSNPFPRAEHIVDILFDLHSEDGQINVNKFTQILKAKEIKMLKTGIATYGDILTASIAK